MDRRSFIRLAGGGVALVAGAGLSACSADYPRAALTPWQGPAAGDELRRWALGYAILSPNSHNLQPWLADLREPDTITLRVDRERLLPMTDPWFRQIVVSQGTFLEALTIALRQRGLQPEVQLFPDGEFAPRGLDDRPVAHVRWSAGASADPLFAQLLRRHTAKVDYDTARPVRADVLDALRAALPAGDAVRFGGTVDPARIEPLRQLCIDAARIELSTPRTMMESLRLTRVGPAEIERHRDGISINSPMLRLASAVGAFDRTQPPAEGSTGFKAAMSRFDGHGRTAMGFVWLSTPVRAGRTRSAEVAAGRAFMRLQLKAAELGLQVHPMSQAPQEFDEMRPHHDALHRALLGRPASEETVQLFCRIGYCAGQQHSPRRGVDAIIRA